MPPESDEPGTTFTAKTFAAYEELWKQLAAQIPELDGVVVTFIWRPEFHQARLPHAQNFAKNNESGDPSFLLRGMEQLARSMANLNHRFQGTLTAGEAAAVDLNKRIIEMRAQIDNEPQPQQPTATDPARDPRQLASLFRAANPPKPS